MRITLHPVPDDEARRVPGQAVGYVGATGIRDLGGRPPAGEVLSYDGRRPHIAGRPVEHADIAEALATEIERTAKRVWGPDHVGPMALASGLNLRSVQRGRILSHGLPAPLLDLLGRASSTPYPRATGYALLSVAYLWDAHMNEHGVGEPGPGPAPMSNEGRALLAARIHEISDRALDLVATMQGEAASAKARARPHTES